MGYALELGDHQVISLTNGFNSVKIFFWYFDTEFFFKSHNELNDVERVCIKIICEIGCWYNL